MYVSAQMTAGCTHCKLDNTVLGASVIDLYAATANIILKEGLCETFYTKTSTDEKKLGQTTFLHLSFKKHSLCRYR